MKMVGPVRITPLDEQGRPSGPSASLAGMLGVTQAREENDGLVASGGFCVPVSPLYDCFRLREPWEYPDRWAFDGPDWHLLVAPRLTRAIRWWLRRRSAAAAALTTYRDHRDLKLDGDL